MLLFACTAAHRLDAVRTAGLPTGTPLYPTLADAHAACRAEFAAEGRVLVVEATDLVTETRSERVDALASTASPNLVVNLAPYLPPRRVDAAGGLVVRAHEGRAEVLLIHRRRVWDLPKGKQDPGEAIPETALREVQEEVGIETLRLLGEADTTVHGYAERKRYSVKTTHWFWMATPQTSFIPEEREGIEAVEYVPWEEAKTRLGYDTLRDLLARLDPTAALVGRP